MSIVKEALTFLRVLGRLWIYVSSKVYN